MTTAFTSSPRLTKGPCLYGERPMPTAPDGDSQKALSATSFDFIKKSSLLSGIISRVFGRLDHTIQNHDGYMNAGRPE